MLQKVGGFFPGEVVGAHFRIQSSSSHKSLLKIEEQ